jgi:hypothetical protein
MSSHKVLPIFMVIYFEPKWNHLFSDKLFSNLSLIYSDYYYGLDLDFVGFKWDLLALHF